MLLCFEFRGGRVFGKEARIVFIGFMLGNSALVEPVVMNSLDREFGNGE